MPGRGRVADSAGATDGPWRVLAGGDRTDGQVIFGEALLPPMTGGPSLHVHTREDEAAYVIEGVLTVQIGDRRLDAASGTLVWLPRNEPHTFANRLYALDRGVSLIA